MIILKDSINFRISNEVGTLKGAFNNIDNNEVLLKLTHLKRLDGQFKFKLNSLYSAMLERSNATNEVNIKMNFIQINW